MEWVSREVRRLVALLKCLSGFGLALVGVPVFAFALLIGSVSGPVLGPFIVKVTRWLPDLARRLSTAAGRPIERPYRQPPAVGSGAAGYWARVAWVWTDVATWRDLLWLAVEPVAGGALLLPGAAVVVGWAGLFLPAVEGRSGWLVHLDGAAGRVALATGGLLLVGLGVQLAPTALRWHARWCAVLLSPTRSAQLRLDRDRLAHRVDRLTASRADATDVLASELRRIERDLHDGAQARLAAAAITLGAAEQLLDTDPDQAKRLYARARSSTQTALSELRDLVSGIHPPVLAERGLSDAIRALTLESGLRVVVSGDVPGRLPDPVESAAYFAVCELLANTAKHAAGAPTRVDLAHDGDRLRITVTDEGAGGADPAGGTGLTGVRRRLGTFDGTLRVTSPAGGPTIAVVEVPCASSSPKTISS